MEQKKFDKAIKDSLGKLEGKYNAAHWQQMEELLDKLPSEHPIEDAPFDALVREKLANLKGAENSASWDKIAQVLTEMERADAQFDAQVFSKLKNIQPAYQQRHWQQLLARLTANFALREKLYRYKLMELTLMILLLLNFYQYLPSKFITNQKTFKKEAPSLLNPVEDQPVFKPIFEEKNNQKPTPKVKESKTGIKDLVKPPIADNQLIKTSTDKPTPLTERILNLKETSNSIPVIEKKYGIAASLPSLNSNLGERTSLSIIMSDMHRHLAMHNSTTGNALINTIPSLQPDFVETQLIIPLDCKDCKKMKVPAQIRVGMVSHIAHNAVYRAGNPLTNVSALTQNGFGYGSGFSIGFKYGRWELETGLAYADKQYDPNIIEQHGGIVNNGGIRQTHFKNIALQTATIPVNLRFNYAILGKGKWHFYTQAGASLNMILRAEYDFAETVSNGRWTGSNASTARISRIDYNNGILAGDGLKENRYLTINMGTGLEYYLSPRWSIFLQPDFHYHFSGNRIGPNQDRINTLSLAFGVRASL